MAELVFGIILLFVAGISTVLSCVFSNDKGLNWIRLMIFGFTILGMGLLCDYRCETLHIPVPSAIEVYQGKTTLQVTYQDGVAIDSVVVYKKK